MLIVLKYVRNMSLKLVIKCLGAGLLLGSTIGLAQSDSNTRQQIAEHNRKVQQYLREKKPELAIPELQALIALDPEDADAHGNLGVMMFFKGDCASAVPQLREAKTLHPSLWRLQVLVGMCELRSNDLTAARADLEEAYPHLEDAKTRMEAGMQLVNIYTNGGDFEKAAPIIAQLRADNPTDVSLLYMSYRIYTEMAGESMLRLSMVNPDSAEMHQIMGHESFRYGDPASAIAHYREAIKLNPRLPGVHFELAEVLNESLSPENKAEALKEYKLALEMNPQDEKAECRLGDLDAERGDLAAAYADYARATSLQPSDIDAKLGQAKTLILMDKRDEALPVLQQVIDAEPANASAHYLMSKVLWQMGRKEEAQQQVDLYKQAKAMKDKLQATYKQLRINPSHHVDDEADAAPKEK